MREYETHFTVVNPTHVPPKPFNKSISTLRRELSDLGITLRK